MSVTVVSEIGQNHQSSVEVCRDLIYRSAHPVDVESWEEVPWRADAVKTTVRDLTAEITSSAATAAYTGDQSFGDTYLEHRRSLELPLSVHRELCAYAHEQGLEFVVTACAPSIVERVDWGVQYWKVASRDLSNGPLLAAMARTGKPMMISTGMAGRDDLARAVDWIAKHDGNLYCIYHCTSSYPCDFGDANLLTIPWLKRHYPDTKVGFSDHTGGVQAGAWAVLLGAEVIEVHVTPSRVLRGSDHRGALSIGRGLWRYIRNIRHAERAMGVEDMFASPAAEAARRKLERSIAASSDLEPGTVLGSSNTVLLSPGTGIPWTARNMVYGRELLEPVPEHELVTMDVVAGST